MFSRNVAHSPGHIWLTDNIAESTPRPLTKPCHRDRQVMFVKSCGSDKLRKVKGLMSNFHCLSWDLGEASGGKEMRSSCAFTCHSPFWSCQLSSSWWLFTSHVASKTTSRVARWKVTTKMMCRHFVRWKNSQISEMMVGLWGLFSTYLRKFLRYLRIFSPYILLGIKMCQALCSALKLGVNETLPALKAVRGQRTQPGSRWSQHWAAHALREEIPGVLGRAWFCQWDWPLNHSYPFSLFK